MPSATAPTGLVDAPVRYVEWTPVIAGAIAASALSFVLFTFGSSLGIALASSSPTWRDASIALAVLSGLYIILITIASFGLGGYIAGRLRSRWETSTAPTRRSLSSGMEYTASWSGPWQCPWVPCLALRRQRPRPRPPPRPRPFQTPRRASRS